MKRIWNALRYGDANTRKCIGSVILFSVAAAGLIVASCLTNLFYLFIFGMLAAIVAIIISQTFTLVDEDFVAEVDRDGTKESVKSVSAKVNKKAAVSKDMEATISEQDKMFKEKAKRQMIEETAADFGRYDAQMLKKVKKKYHIRKDHRPIVIDSSSSYHIKECPAFIWRAHNKVLLLLLEKEPRRICISRDLIHNMGYKPGVKADVTKEYVAFQKENLVTKVFREYLPDFLDSRVKNDPLKYKNLYTIYPDICITNRCAYQVMDLLMLNFMPEDKITQSDKINGFFKKIYAANILYKDKVYSITEYKDRVEKTLKDMCYAEMPEREFAITLENLVKAKLISQQYAEHYTELRGKLSTRKVEVTYKK